MTDAEIAEAAESQVVVVFGHSDDTTVFHGAIEAQVNTIDGAEIYLTPRGIFEDCACNCAHAQAAKAKAQIIKAIWCKGPYVWHYETAIPHCHFDIIDNQPADNLKFVGNCFSIRGFKFNIMRCVMKKIKVSVLLAACLFVSL